MSLAVNQDTRVGTAPSAKFQVSAGSLKARAELVRQLMQTHPEEVRSVALPVAVAARWLASDPANAVLLEREASMAGDLAALEVDDFDQSTGQRVFVLHVPATASQVALHPTASLKLPNLLHRRVAVRGVQLGSDMVAESILPASASKSSSSIAGALTAEAAVLPAAPTALLCSTIGEQHTAVLILQFPNNTPAFPGSYGGAAWWQQAIAGQGKSVNSLWSEMTAGGTYATVDVYGPLTLSQNYGCADYLQMRSAALTLASSTIDLSRYTRVVLGFPASSCSYGGLADLGCNGADALVPHPYSVVWMPIVTNYTSSLGVWASLAHELGHNLGLNHANTLDFGTTALGPIDFQETNPGTVYGTGATTATGAVTAVDTEYGDAFSVMGSPWLAGPGPYSAEHRAKLLGWVPSSGTSNGLGTITSAGTYTVQPASTGTGLRALRVLRDPASASWIWLEYRNGGTTYDAANLASVSGENVTQGAVVHYENGYGDHEKTFQLDMTPTGKGNRFADGALTPGITWSDPYSPLSLKVNRITSAGLEASVQYDSTCASFSVPTDAMAAAGASGTVTVSAAASCSWTASSNAAWMSLSSAGAGTTVANGVVSGTGNGSFGWTAVANTGVGQRVTYFTVGRVSQRVIQLGSGANVVSLLPANGYVDPNQPVLLSLGLRDTGGLQDLQTVELDATAAGTPPCIVVAEFLSGVPTFYLLDPDIEEFTGGLSASNTSLTTSGCTLRAQGTGASANGSGITLALNLTFPSSSPGVRALYATANSGTELPLGILSVGTVTAPQTNSTLTATTTVLAAVPTSVLPGGAVGLSATVAGVSGSVVPTGRVTFLDGAQSVGTAGLDGAGKATLNLPTLANGTHSFTAVYSGDASFAASTSLASAVTVGQVASTTLLSTSSARVSVGGSATLTISVGHATAAPVPSGTITLRDGITVLGTVALRDASASFALSNLTAGTHSYTASYSGDAVYLLSTSSVVTVTAGQFPATVSIATTPVVLAGAAVQVVVTASGGTAAGTMSPTGTVLIRDGDQSLGSVSLAGGTGTLTTGSLSTGAHALTASYNGDSNFAAATSGAASLQVADFAVSGAGAGITVNAGASTGNTAALMLTPGSGGFPVGVAFVCNGAPQGATCSVSPGTIVPGSNAVPVTVTVTTTAPSSRSAAAFAGTLGLPLLGLLTWRRKGQAGRQRLTLLLASLAVGLGLAGCGAGPGSATASTTTSGSGTSTGGSGGTPAGSTTLTVQAVASANGATLTHSVSFTLKVN